MRQRARGLRIALGYRDFRLLWLGQLVGDLSEALGRIALAVLVFDETDSSFLTAAVFAVVVLPFLGPGQALTAWAERFPRRTVLVTADLVRAALYAAIALPMPIGARFAILLVASLADPPFFSVRRALMSSTLPDEHFADAVTLTAFTTEACILAGAALAGFLTEAIGPEGVLLLDAGMFVVSALVLGAIGVGRQVAGNSKRVAAQLRDGWRALVSEPYVRRISWFFPMASIGILGTEALLTPYVKSELDRGDAIIGWLAAAISVGVLLTAALLRSHDSHSATVKQAAHLAMIGGAVATAAFALAPTLGAATVAYLGVGVVFATRVPTMVVLGQRIEDNVRASAMSVVDGGYAVAQLVAALGAGALAEVTGPGTACLLFVVSTAAVGVVATALPIRSRASELVS